MIKDTAVLVRGARQLITLRGSAGPRRGAALRDLGIIQDGAVLVENGVIATLGPARRVENLSAARRAREIDASGNPYVDQFIHGRAEGPIKMEVKA